MSTSRWARSRPVGEAPAARLAHAIPAFPTRSEIWVRLLAKYEQAERPRELRAVG